jgi:hypothetical protein
LLGAGLNPAPFFLGAETVREVAVWIRVADVYNRFSGRVPWGDARLELYRLLVSCADGVRDFNLRALPKGLAQEAAAELGRHLTPRESRSLLQRFLSEG